ncbi:MAG: two-component sensor histidine kinase [Gemmatimonadetes bacterium]|nr:two-component sensor histidine kinase [Gemmatimonadota bacterium]
MSGIGRRKRWARWGWLVTTLTLCVAVIAGAWNSYRSASRASDDLIRGEAHTLRDVLFATTHPGAEGPRADFDSLVASLQDAGLRYVAWVVGTDGVVVASGGQASPVPFEVLPASSDPRFVRLDSRIRVYFPPPRPRLGSLLERFRPGFTPPGLVLEFEPVVAADLVARARRSLFVAGIVAAVLMAAGFLFWRMSQRIEENERRAQEQRRLLALGEMAAVLAHEIRNPLASLKGHAQLLVERLRDDAAAHKKAARVVEEATRLEALTADLLDFVRSGPMDLRPVDPAALLRASAAELPDAGIEIDGAEAPDRWLLDERRFGQAVLVNLLRNATQASPPERPPQARVALENGTLVFIVHDFGPGLPAGSEERIFDPFFTTRTTGTGLGLPVARRIVEAHGGCIEAANAQGGGAVFRVELPRKDT